MSALTDLIRKASGSGEQAQAAKSALSSRGVEIVPELLASIRGSTGKRLHLIRETLLRIHDPDIVSAVMDSLKSKDFDVWKAAFDILGNPNFKFGLEALLAQLANVKNTETKRAQAAKAIGDLADPRAVPPLLEIARGGLDSGSDLLMVSISVALAKLGRHDIAPVTASLARESKDPTIQVHAVKALKYLVTSDMPRILAATLKSSDNEICGDSVDGLFFLGTREAIALLSERGRTANSIIWQHISRRVRDLTGESFPEWSEKLLVWWRHAAASFQPGICYRLGEPMWLPNVTGQLEKEPERCESLLEEIYVITGQRFGIHPLLSPTGAELPEVRREIRRWWRQHSRDFDSGALYKFGFRQTIPYVP